MNKKAISQVVLFVLFIGFAIALGTSVFLYQKSFVEDTGSRIVKYGSSQIECDSVFLNVKPNAPACTQMVMTNTGSFTIDGVVARSLDPNDEPLVIHDSIIDNPWFPLAPKANTTSAYPFSEFELIPLLYRDDELFACDSKAVMVSCP